MLGKQMALTDFLNTSGKTQLARDGLTLGNDMNKDKLEQKNGPGRPRLANKKVTISIRIKPELLERISGNRSAFIEAAIFDKLGR